MSLYTTNIFLLYVPLAHMQSLELGTISQMNCMMLIRLVGHTNEIEI
jgi:hypothetical protein